MSSSSSVYITSWMNEIDLNLNNFAISLLTPKNIAKCPCEQAWKHGDQTHVSPLASLLQRSWRHSSLIQNGQQILWFCLGNIWSSHVSGDNDLGAMFEYISICCNIYLYLILSIFVSIYLYLSLSISLSLCVSLSVYLRTYLPTYLRVPMHVYVCIYMDIYIYI